MFRPNFGVPSATTESTRPGFGRLIQKAELRTSSAFSVSEIWGYFVLNGQTGGW